MLISHNIAIGYNFYNDKVKEVIAPGIIAEPFTFVPIRAGQMELIAGNAIVVGDVTEGYGGTEPSVSVELNWVDIEGEGARYDLATILHSDTITYVHGSFGNWEADRPYEKGEYVVFVRPPPAGGSSIWRALQDTYGEVPGISSSWGFIMTSAKTFRYRRVGGSFFVTIPKSVREDAVYYIRVKDPESVVRTASYKAMGGDTVAEVKIGLEADMTDKDIPFFGTPHDYLLAVLHKEQLFMESPFFEEGGLDVVFRGWEVTAYVVELGLMAKYPALKIGAVHGYGIVYKDEWGRQCSVIRNAAMEVNIPWFSEEEEIIPSTIPQLTFKLAHKPPAWAKSYEIVTCGNISMEYFLQIRINEITSISEKRYAINIQETIDHTRKQNMRWRVPDYIYREGDRVRLMGTLESDGSINKYDEQVYDYEIEGTSLTEYGEIIGGDWLIVQAAEVPASFVGESDVVAEIYRPQIGLGTMPYYGTGMVFGIGEDEHGNLYHKGDVDQTFDGTGLLLTEAEVINTANDCWKYMRINYGKEDTTMVPFWAESIAPSDWWENQTRLTSQGWPFLYSKTPQEQKRLRKRLRHGGYLYEGTQTNNIARFFFEDFQDFPEKDGPITGLKEVGFALKILQYYKETSVYIQRIQTFNPDGTEQFTLVDRLLGTKRPMGEDFGCQHPESILAYGRYLYYWDHTEGKFIRSAPNGQFPISEYNMKRWFTDVQGWIRDRGGREKVKVRTGMNIDYNEVWLTFVVENEVRGVIFNEDENSWISRTDLKTDAYVYLGGFFGHIYKQSLWIMNANEGQGYLNWSGKDVVGELEFVSNINPERNKVFNALAVVGNEQPEVLAGYIMIPADASYEEMRTYIARWERREGVYFGQLLKDMNTPGRFGTELSRVMNGREMRGRYCFARLRFERRDQKVRIFSVVMYSVDSERNVKN